MNRHQTALLLGRIFGEVCKPHMVLYFFFGWEFQIMGWKIIAMLRYINPLLYISVLTINGLLHSVLEIDGFTGTHSDGVFSLKNEE